MRLVVEMTIPACLLSATDPIWLELETHDDGDGKEDLTPELLEDHGNLEEEVGFVNFLRGRGPADIDREQVGEERAGDLE